MRSLNITNLTLEQQEEILNGPGLPPPPGVVPNFDDPPNKNGVGIAVSVTSLMITILVVALRAYAKIYCVKRLRLEDYLVIPALGTFVASMVVEYWMLVDVGFIVHQWDVRARDLPKVYFVMHVGANFIAVTIMIMKAAILLEWIHIFVPPCTHNYFYWVNTIVLYIHTLMYIGWIIVENAACMPYQKIWDITITEGRCIDIKKIFLPIAGLNLIANVIIFLLPQRAIWTLQMSFKKKLGAGLVFAIGALACITAGTRLHATIEFAYSDDIMFTEGGMYLFSIVEMTCLFLIFCVPAIPRVFVDLGMKARFKTMVSQHTGRPITTQTPGNSGTSSASLASRRADANRRRSGSFVPRRDMNPIDEVWGPTIEITAIEHDDTDCEGVKGILRTREISTEVTNAVPATDKDQARSSSEEAEEGK